MNVHEEPQKPDYVQIGGNMENSPKKTRPRRLGPRLFWVGGCRNHKKSIDGDWWNKKKQSEEDEKREKRCSDD